MSQVLLSQQFNLGDGKKIFLDYGGPNIGKAMHIGHMRSFNIGEAFKRLYRKLGFETVSDIFLGDWGMPMGLIMAMLEKQGVFDDYYSGKKQLTIEVMNTAYPQASQLKTQDEKFKQRAEQITLFFQQKQQPYYDFWKRLRDVSVAEIKKVCKLLNVDFDLWNGESNWNDIQQKERDAAKFTFFTTTFGKRLSLYEDLYTVPEDPEEAYYADMGIYFDEPDIFDFVGS